MSVLGIAGNIASGKDTVAKAIIYLTSDAKDSLSFENFVAADFGNRRWKSPFEVKRFAGKLKQVVALYIGCNVQDLEDQEFKNTPLGPEWDGMTPRTFLQLLGTQGMRDVIHSNVHVNGLFADYKLHKKEGGFQRSVKNDQGIPIDFQYEVEYPKWIIPDVRFPNECDAILKHDGLLFKVVNPRIVSKSTHESERALDDYKNFHQTIVNDGSLEDLLKNVEGLCKFYNII